MHLEFLCESGEGCSCSVIKLLSWYNLENLFEPLQHTELKEDWSFYLVEGGENCKK